MALRVLLADESSTIKKVFQLALQDYAVDVRSVNVGTDVPEIVADFKPDIVFADVILQKMNGYDVCQKIKSTPDTQNLPVVLMWSGFMSVDKNKFQEVGANAQLEKPFEPDQLRELIQKLVPKTQKQDLSSYLSFPKMPEIEAQKPSPEAIKTQPAPSPTPSSSADEPPAPPTEDSAIWDMDNFESIDEFSQKVLKQEDPQVEEVTGADFDSFQEVPLSSNSQQPPSESEELDVEEMDSDWVQESISQFQVDPEKLNRPLPEVPTKPAPVADELEVEEISLQSEPTTNSPVAGAVSAQQIEEYIKAQCQSTIEDIVWKVVPELAKQVLEKEIQKLIREKENFQ